MMGLDVTAVFLGGYWQKAGTLLEKLLRYLSSQPLTAPGLWLHQSA
jgi:hypothetical protein